jgi:hypothetical protein
MSEYSLLADLPSRCAQEGEPGVRLLLSSDGGVLLLRGVERQLGLAARLAGCIRNKRNRQSILHGRMMGAMIDQFCASYRRTPASIILDIDDTFDAVHGHQQQSLFNAHCDELLSADPHL